LVEWIAGSTGSMSLALLEWTLAATLVSRAWRWGVHGALAFCTAAAVLLLDLRITGVSIARCGCFGVRELSFGWHLVLLSGMALLALVAIGTSSGTGTAARGIEASSRGPARRW